MCRKTESFTFGAAAGSDSRRTGATEAARSNARAASVFSGAGQDGGLRITPAANGKIAQQNRGNGATHPLIFARFICPMGSPYRAGSEPISEQFGVKGKNSRGRRQFRCVSAGSRQGLDPGAGEGQLYRTERRSHSVHPCSQEPAGTGARLMSRAVSIPQGSWPLEIELRRRLRMSTNRASRPFLEKYRNFIPNPRVRKARCQSGIAGSSTGISRVGMDSSCKTTHRSQRTRRT
jgi:hypothetical protein